MLNVALALAARGFAIFPCDPESRSPLVKFTKEATTDAATIRGWWDARPTAMPAILLGPRNLVVDVDPRNGGDASLDAWIAEHPECADAFRDAPRVRTARNGIHFYFTVPEGVAVKNGEWIKGVDLKTGNAFVIAPGAVRSDGLAYSDMREGSLVDVPAVIANARRKDATPRPTDPPVIWTVSESIPETMGPALVALLSPLLASKGKRHDVARAVGGALAVTGWTDGDIAAVVGGLPSDVPADRVRDALAAATRAREGLESPQWGALERAGYAPAIVAAARTLADGGKLAALDDLPTAPAVVLASGEADLWGGFRISDITKPLPPIAWLCESLVLAPGAPSVVAGRGGLGKSFLAQSFAVSIVTGRSFLGTKPVNGGRVIHFDFEQGRRECESRYQRLACELLKNEADIAGALANLEIISPPPVYMNLPGVEAALKKKCEGVSLAIIDSLRAACPGVDENDSQMREPLDMLLRVSEATGCTFIVIHHARKAGERKADAIESLRGTSAINDASQTVIVCQPIKEEDEGGGFLVSCGKSRIGRRFSSFALRLDDTPLDRPFMGLAFRTIDAEAVAEEREKVENETVEGKVLNVIRAAPGGMFVGNRDMLCAALRGKVSIRKVRIAVANLQLQHRIVELKDSTGKLMYKAT